MKLLVDAIEYIANSTIDARENTAYVASFKNDYAVFTHLVRQDGKYYKSINGQLEPYVVPDGCFLVFEDENPEAYNSFKEMDIDCQRKMFRFNKIFQSQFPVKFGMVMKFPRTKCFTDGYLRMLEEFLQRPACFSEMEKFRRLYYQVLQSKGDQSMELSMSYGDSWEKELFAEVISLW